LTTFPSPPFSGSNKRKRIREIEAKIISLGSEKRGFFACFALKRNSKNLSDTNSKGSNKVKQNNSENHFGSREKIRSKIRRFFLLKRKNLFFCFETKNVKQIMCENIFGSKTKICEFKQFIFFLGKKIVVSFLKRKMLSTMMRKNLF
jgi:hypothetical protein